MFMKKYKPKNGEQFNFAKGFDGSYLPPCLSVLQQKVMRSSYITSMWQSATNNRATDLDPTNWCWKQDEQTNSYQLIWFEGSVTRKLLDVLIKDSDSQDDDDDQTIEEYDIFGKKFYIPFIIFFCI